MTGTSTPVFEGTLLLRSDDGYEPARRSAVWNERKPERRPDAILIAASDDDVIAAVRWAAAEGIPVGIRSGGHSWIGNGVRDGGLLIDLSQLQDFDIDAVTRTAVVRPAVTGTVLNAALDEQGLVFPTGHCPSVGVGGFLLGGGYGWNSRAFGPACLSVTAIDVVLADGRFVHATDESHPEIMWAARGAGPGFFGVVTRFYLDVYPAYRQIRRSAWVFPLAMRDQVLTWGRDTVLSLSPWVEMSVKVGYSAGIDEPVATLTAVAFWADDDGGALMDPILACPFLDQNIRCMVDVESSLADLYSVSDTLTPKGFRYAVDGIWADAPAAEIVPASRTVLDNLPTRQSFLLWMLWGGYPTQDNACWSAQAPLYISPNAVWSDPADDLRCEQWAHGDLGDMRDWSIGTQFSDANPADRPDPGLSAENAERLEQLRQTYDPDRRFRSYLDPTESTTSLGGHRQRQSAGT